MWHDRSRVLRTIFFLLAAVVYLAFLPIAVQSAIGSFAVGWMMVDITSKIFD
jgi:hypothetical protein